MIRYPRLLLFFVLLFPPPSVTRAPDCVCVKDPHPPEEKVKADRRRVYDQATAVFAGKVVALDAYRVTFGLQKRWKGESSLNQVVLA